MKYKVVKPVTVMGHKEKETFEAEPHAVETHLAKGEVVEVKEKKKGNKKK